MGKAFCNAYCVKFVVVVVVLVVVVVVDNWKDILVITKLCFTSERTTNCVGVKGKTILYDCPCIFGGGQAILSNLFFAK